MATNSEEKRKSATDVGIPWRQPGVDPTRTGFDEQSRAGAAGMYAGFGNGPPSTPGDMENLTLRQVYTTLVSATGITVDPLDTEAIEGYIEALVVNSEVSDYNWSGCSIFTYRPSVPQLTQSIPAVLISDTFALGSHHNGPSANTVCYFRTPAGGVTSGTVAEIWQIAGTDLRLIRFESDPGATLKRYSICTDASLIDYNEGPLWLLNQNHEIRLRYRGTLSTYYTTHTASSWGNSLIISSGSGRPAFVATDENDLILTGTLTYATGNTRVSALLSAIQAELDEYTETLSTESITAPTDNPIQSFGVRARVEARVRQTIVV